jgi:sugar lactone lactonase YvrE
MGSLTRVGVQVVAFAGEYVCVASEQEKEPEKYPESVKYAGDVFKCYVGVSGHQLPRAQRTYLPLGE